MFPKNLIFVIHKSNSIFIIFEKDYSTSHIHSIINLIHKYHLRDRELSQLTIKKIGQTNIAQQFKLLVNKVHYAQ